MKVQIASDIHLEINVDIKDYKTILVPNAEILFLLGDIGDPNTTDYVNFLTYCSKNWNKVYLIAGNHEYYNNFTIDENNITIKNITKLFTNVKFLNKEYDTLSYDNGENESKDLSEDETSYLIVGLTLWSNVKNGINNYLNDYNFIHYTKLKNGRRLLVSPYNIRNEYKNNVIWLKSVIEKFNYKKIIILSHHIPFIIKYEDYFLNKSEEICNDYYNKNQYETLSSGYCSNTICELKNLINEEEDYLNGNDKDNDDDNQYEEKDHDNKKNIDFWFFGHSHNPNNKIVENVRVVSNPLGYLNHEYNNIEKFKNCVVEI